MSTPAVMISLVNETATAISEADLSLITHALSVQLGRDVAPIYGIVPALEHAANDAPVKGDARLSFFAKSDEPNALGYHDEGPDGKPYGKVFTDPTLNNGGTVLSGSDAMSVTASHELLEMVEDGPANKWVDGPGGIDYAYELCDAVEGDSYEIDGVSVSNFVYPAFFDPQAEEGSRFDHLGKLSAPFTMTAGGYQITRTEPGKTGQVFAMGVAGETFAKDMNGRSYHVHFGPDYPEEKKETTRMRAVRRRG